jgi:flagellar biogenesis protein FliO
MTGVAIIPTVLSIAIVLAVLGLTLFILRWATRTRTPGGRRNRRSEQLVSIVERHSVGRNGAIVVMQYGTTEHVLGVTETSITPLAEGITQLDEPDDDVIDLSDSTDTEEVRKGRVASRLDAVRERTVRR